MPESIHPSPGDVVDTNHLLLFPEREPISLPAGFLLSATGPGTFKNEQKPKTAKRVVTLPVPLTVDSYLLQFNLGTESSRNQIRVLVVSKPPSQ